MRRFPERKRQTAITHRSTPRGRRLTAPDPLAIEVLLTQQGSFFTMILEIAGKVHDRS
jgi:hypothetical protein